MLECVPYSTIELYYVVITRDTEDQLTNEEVGIHFVILSEVR